MKKRILNGFAGNKSGSVLVVFAVIIPVLLLAAGVAIDHGQAVREKTIGQGMLDAALLAAAVAYQNKDDEGGARKQALASLNAENKKLDSFVAKFDFGDDEVSGTLESKTKTSIMSMFGYVDLEWNVSGAARYLRPPKVDYSLVIDISQSMDNGGHMGALRSGLLEFSRSAFTGVQAGDVSVTLVPYANAVSFAPEFSKWLSKINFRAFNGCFNEEREATMASLSKSGLRTYFATPDMQMSNGRRFCPEAGTQVSFYARDQSELDSRVNTLQSYQGTATPSGLSWGWRTLDPDWRSNFGQSTEFPRSYDNAHKKVLVLFTDGLPYVRPWVDEKVSNEDKESSRQEQLVKFKAVCSAIQADGRIDLYSIGYGDKMDDSEKQALHECTAGSGKYFDADKTTLSNVFKAIVKDGSAIALTR